MIRRSLSLATVLVALLTGCATTPEGAAPPAAPQVAPDVTALRPLPGRLPHLADPTRYELALTVDPRAPEFSGVTTVHLRVRVPTPVLHFHASQMAISSVTARVGGKVLSGAVSAASDPGARTETSEHVATFPEFLPVGEVVLTFTHRGPFDTHLSGLYRAREGDDWYASSQFEVADAKKAFPCLDEPGWKVPFQITLKVPEGMGAFSNAPEASRKSEAGWTTVTFQDTQPIPTYLVGMAVGPFEVVEGPPAGKTPVRGLAPRGRGAYLGEALQMHSELVPLLEDYFAQPYGFQKLDAVAVLEFAAGAMENPGLIIYREELLLLDPQTSSEGARRGVATVVAHELAHQWFGNLVTLAWWDDLWLNEAFAEWMAGKVVDRWRPEFETGLSQLDRRERMLNADALSTAIPIRRKGQGAAIGPQFAYATFKGSPLLGMIEQWIGPERFREGVRSYLRDRAFQNATSEELFVALEKAAGSDQPVREVMSRFIDRAGAPVIAAQLDCSNPAAPKVALTQTRYTSLGAATPAGFPEGKPWLVPACVAYPREGRVLQECALVEGERVELTLKGATGCPAWIHPNAGENGYYRWTVPAPLLQALATGLQMPASDDASRQLLRRSQTAFLDQAWAMVSSGTLQPAEYLTVVEQVARRADRRQLREVVIALVRVANIWEELARRPQFAALVRRVLEPTARELTWSRDRGDDVDTLMLRPPLLSAVAYYGQAAWALEGAQAQALKYLASPNQVAPEVAASLLPVAARAGLLKLEELLALLERARTPGERLTAVAALGSLPPQGGLDQAIALLATEKIRLQDFGSLLTAAMSRPESRRPAFEALKRHWTQVALKSSAFGGGAGQLTQVLGNFCEQASRDEALAFFAAQPSHSDRGLSNATETSNRCIAVRQYGAESMQAVLQPAKGKRK